MFNTRKLEKKCIYCSNNVFLKECSYCHKWSCNNNNPCWQLRECDELMLMDSTYCQVKGKLLSLNEPECRYCMKISSEVSFHIRGLQPDGFIHQRLVLINHYICLCCFEMNVGTINNDTKIIIGKNVVYYTLCNQCINNNIHICKDTYVCNTICHNDCVINKIFLIKCINNLINDVHRVIIKYIIDYH